jgi:hypothetical protein
MEIEYNGKQYNITNWPEFKQKLLYAIGFQLQNAVVEDMERMGLFQGGQLTQVNMEIRGDEIVIWSDAPYAIYLEFGTYAYWQFYGVKSFPDPGYPAIPKKKELSAEERKKLPKGMQPFAFYRRLFYNEKKLKEMIEKGIKAAKG